MKFYKEKVAFFRQNPPLTQTPFGACFEAGRLEREKENDELRKRIAELEAELDAYPLLDDLPAGFECYSADCLSPATCHSPTGSNRPVYCRTHFNRIIEMSGVE